MDETVWPPRSRLGLGLAALGRPGYINLGHARDLEHDYDLPRMERRCHRVLDAAWAEGVRYFDAARSYGRAEEFLASWLPGHEGATVGSKWGYRYTADWRVDAEKHESKDHSLGNPERQLAESRALLGGRLALYQIHSATLESGVLDDPAVLSRLARLKDDGLRVGLSLSGPRQNAALDRALAVRMDGRPLFDAVQATWNLLEPSVGPALAEARAAGWLVIVKEAMANGRLAQSAPLAQVAAALGVGADAVAIAAALEVGDVVLSGAATVEHVRQNAAGLRLALPPLPALAEPPEVYWSARSQLPWN
jgi:aryl-alcohol dehydrogenase-like predicted oxidoreductase